MSSYTSQCVGEAEDDNVCNANIAVKHASILLVLERLVHRLSIGSRLSFNALITWHWDADPGVGTAYAWEWARSASRQRLHVCLYAVLEMVWSRRNRIMTAEFDRHSLTSIQWRNRGFETQYQSCCWNPWDIVKYTKKNYHMHSSETPKNVPYTKMPICSAAHREIKSYVSFYRSSVYAIRFVTNRV